MTNEDVKNILTPLLSGLLGGVVVAILNYLFTRKKTKAEVKKLEAETEKIRIEIGKHLADISATVDYQLSKTSERIIYDSTKGEGYDFEGVETSIWVWNEEQGKYVGRTDKGRGTLKVEKGGVLNIHRTNTEGRYEARLLKYWDGDVERDFIPKNEIIAGQRKLRASCEAKVVAGEHVLEFVLKESNKETNKTLARKAIKVTDNSWTPVDVYFQFSPTVDCRLLVYDKEVSRAPSSVQIRKFVLAEKLS